MSRIISKCRRGERTIFNTSIDPYCLFSEYEGWRTNNLLYRLRHNNGILHNSDSPIKTISTRRSGITYGKTLITCSGTKMSFCSLGERRR